MSIVPIEFVHYIYHIVCSVITVRRFFTSDRPLESIIYDIYTGSQNLRFDRIRKLINKLFDILL